MMMVRAPLTPGRVCRKTDALSPVLAPSPRQSKGRVARTVRARNWGLHCTRSQPWRGRHASLGSKPHASAATCARTHILLYATILRLWLRLFAGKPRTNLSQHTGTAIEGPKTLRVCEPHKSAGYDAPTRRHSRRTDPGWLLGADFKSVGV